jgi:hypothetical protein
MRAKHILTLLLVFGSGFYVAILYQGQQSFENSLRALDSHALPSTTQVDAVTRSESNAAGSMPSTITHRRIFPKDALKNASSARHLRFADVLAESRMSRGKTTRRFEFNPNPGDNRPPYDTVVDINGTIIGDVSNILDFAVIGFGKCGTTSIMSWLQERPELQIFPREVYDLMLEDPGAFVKKIYNMPTGKFKRGYKSPVDLALPHVIDYYRQYFPKTKLIVGVR